MAFVLISKLYRQMYANTGIATDSARVVARARSGRGCWRRRPGAVRRAADAGAAGPELERHGSGSAVPKFAVPQFRVRGQVAMSSSRLASRASSHVAADCALSGAPRPAGPTGPRSAGRRAWASPKALRRPRTWDVPAGKNVSWRVAVPGLGHSSPIVWGNQVCTASAISGKRQPGAEGRPLRRHRVGRRRRRRIAGW